MPLALLSAAWTASLTASVSPASTVSAPAAESPGVLPDGSGVPSQAIEDPASLSDPSAPGGQVTGTVGGVQGDATQIVASSTTNGIPSAALAAYQRAETVINAADPACKLPWQLVAAIGRVESDHGRFGGSTLTADGLAKPDILGVPLTGTGGTALIRDTDAGQYDGDTAYDRAVGPMQFIPSTWAAVGVDADNDGVRNPQDVDDAALAAAVYLCSGEGPAGDLSTLTGQRSSVFRYNQSESYVDLVLSIMDAYLAGDFTQVPDGTVAAGFLTPTRTADTVPGGGQGGKGGRGDQGGKNGGGQTARPVEPAQEAPAEQPDEPAPAEQPEADDDKGDGKKPGAVLPSAPVTVPSLPQTSIKPVDDVLTLAQAIVQCTLDGYVDNLLKKDDPFDRCIKDYTTKP
ncbi:lytic murein transglycosylase [Nocardioides litoris]|uniref:lytic murein transglycosylase n=1 Tax=Nocardioides litoris TaxID=1926648 RepID=UPI001FE332CE|nr:lytic murein transglycosylase [Nocardioides litoris]